MSVIYDKVRFDQVDGEWTVTVLERAADSQQKSAASEGMSIQFIEDPTIEIQMVAVSQNPYAIRYIKDPTIEVQMVAVSQNPSVVVMMAAVEQNPDAQHLIN